MPAFGLMSCQDCTWTVFEAIILCVVDSATLFCVWLWSEGKYRALCDRQEHPRWNLLVGLFMCRHQRVRRTVHGAMPTLLNVQVRLKQAPQEQHVQPVKAVKAVKLRFDSFWQRKLPQWCLLALCEFSLKTLCTDVGGGSSVWWGLGWEAEDCMEGFVVLGEGARTSSAHCWSASE